MYVSVDETPEYVGYIQVKANGVVINTAIAACDIHGVVWVYKTNDKNEYVLTPTGDSVEVVQKYGEVILSCMGSTPLIIKKQFEKEKLINMWCPCFQ